MSAEVVAPSTGAVSPLPAQPLTIEQQQQIAAAQAQAAAQPQFNPQAVAPQASASLYVGELDPSVTEAMLFEMFNMIGPVASIRVCRDAVTRRSLGYAYVNFHNVVDGERALETLNYTLIKGKPCRIMWSQRDPALRKTGAGNIFIKNLDPSIDNKALHDTFSAFGNILSCKVALDSSDGQSKGYGFVHYETYEAAENAIKHVNGMLLNDRKVYVGHHIPKKERQAKLDELRSRFTNVYVKNLADEVDDDEFRSMFEKYGAITSAVVQRDEAGNSKGFGFVNFETHDEAQQAVDDLHESEHKSKKLFVTRAQKKHEREEELKKMYEQAKMEKLSKYQGVNLYVKNLEDDIDDERLRQEFQVYGVITSAKIMKDEKTNVSKGFGFVCFSSQDEATKAVTEMNGRMIGSKPIYVALAQRKEVRKSQLEAQLAQRNHMRMQAGVPGMPGAPTYGMPGAPMFYPGPGSFIGPNQRVAYPQQQMVPRPRWATQPPNQPPQGFPGAPMAPYGQVPQGFAGVPTQGVRPPRQPRGGQRGGVPAQGPRPQASPAGSPASIPGAAAPRGGLGAGRGGYKYSPSTRPPTNGPAPTPTANGNTLTAAALASAPPDQQKQMLGERLYPLIHQQQAELAGKITGMLLEMDNGELLHLLENQEALDGKIGEAVTVLKQHQAVADSEVDEPSA